MADGAALDAFWLPDLGDLEVGEKAFGPAHVAMRVPAITPHRLREMLSTLRERGLMVLAQRSVDSIVESIDAAARRLADPGDALHAELVRHLPGLTGYSPEMIRVGIERMAAGWRAESLRGALLGELGDLELLDRFQPRQPGGRQRAYGPRLSVHVLSGNIPGVAVSSVIRALCVKSPSFGKLAAGEPYMAVCFARALASVDQELGSCVALTYWAGGSEDLEVVAYSEAEAVVAYGGDETIASVACRVPPQVRFIGYPNRVGAALVARTALKRESVDRLAERAARDVVTFDQQGCVSPHIMYVEEGGAVGPEELARRLADALERQTKEIPRGAMTPGESTLVHQTRAQAEMRGATVLASEKGTEWTVILERRAEFEPSPLNRVIQLRAVASLSEAVAALRPVGKHLQTVAVAVAAEELEGLASRLGAFGVTRIVPIGEAAWPAPHWHHDGRFQYLDLLRFVDLDA